MTNAPQDRGSGALAPAEERGSMGVVPNAKHQTAEGFIAFEDYELAIVEFDDLGRCYERRQMEGVATRLDTLRTNETDVIVLVFVHGWKHDARTNDENLTTFREVLVQAAAHEAKQSSTSRPRPVLGIFVGWRGLSEYGLRGAVENATFWGRQAAAQRVATGSVRELFGRLRHYRNHRLKDKKGAPLLVITGHSFGGMIVFSALAQSLIEAASSPVGDVETTFADLVLLINPAIEAARYIPIYDLVARPAFRDDRTSQLPCFICAQATNDDPVGVWFPLGNSLHKIDEATIDDLEKECTTHALGFVPSFRTHDLDGPANGAPFVLKPVDSSQTSPFWVVHATKTVIDGHGGIWLQPFRDFLAGIIFQHVNDTKTPSLDGRALPAGAGSMAASVTVDANELGSLAEFVRKLKADASNSPPPAPPHIPR